MNKKFYLRCKIHDYIYYYLDMIPNNNRTIFDCWHQNKNPGIKLNKLQIDLYIYLDKLYNQDTYKYEVEKV